MLRSRFLAIPLGALLAGGAACERRPAAPAPAAPTPLAQAPAEAYRPPADGRLTPKQVDRYLVVAQRLRDAQRRAAPTPSPATFQERVNRLGDTLEAMAPDVRTGRDVFGSAEEYLWVKERILEVDGALLTAKLNADELAMLQRTLAELRTRRGDAADEPSRKLLSEQIASFEAEAERTSREAREKEPETIRTNIKVLEPYRARLNALQDEIARVAPDVGLKLAPKKAAEPGPAGPRPAATPPPKKTP